MFRLCAIGLVLLAGWMVYLDAVVTSRFEGRRFEVPSRVYARPLELFDGAKGALLCSSRMDPQYLPPLL